MPQQQSHRDGLEERLTGNRVCILDGAACEEYNAFLGHIRHGLVEPKDLVDAIVLGRSEHAHMQKSYLKLT